MFSQLEELNIQYKEVGDKILVLASKPDAAVRVQKILEDAARRYGVSGIDPMH